MERCEICGRHPAKRMTFKGHQGYLIGRREIDITGVFCRDHAIAAYMSARGATLKGMWFSPESLVFGAVRSVFDTVKLLDLPGEVRDEPFVVHIVACPNCSTKNSAPAGPVECHNCKRSFIVASCGQCGVVHAVKEQADYGAIHFECRGCKRHTQGPDAIRNWIMLITGRASAEIAAKVALADGPLNPVEYKSFLELIRAVFRVEGSVLKYIEEHFNSCLKHKYADALYACSANLNRDLLELLLMVGVSIAGVDGNINQNEFEELFRISRILGIDFDTFYNGGRHNNSQQSSFRPWHEVLEVASNASMEEVLFAYRKHAKKYHPDVSLQASAAEQAAAGSRMKEINAAFEQAKKDVQAREKCNAATATESTKRKASSDVPARDASRANGTTAQKAAADKAAQEAKEHVQREKYNTAAASTSSEKNASNDIPVKEASRADVAAPAQTVAPDVAAKEAIEIPTVQINQDSSESDDAKVPAFATRKLVSPEHSIAFGWMVAAAIIIIVIVVVAASFVPQNRPIANKPVIGLPPVIQEPPPNEFPSVVPVPPPPLDVQEAPVPIIPKNTPAPPSVKQTDPIPHSLQTPAPDAEWYIQLGIANARAGRQEQAIVDISEAIKIDPKNAKAYFNRGVVWLMFREYANAIRDFNKTIILDPNYPYVHEQKALALDENRRQYELEKSASMRSTEDRYYPQPNVYPQPKPREQKNIGPALVLGQKVRAKAFWDGLELLKAGQLASAIREFNDAKQSDPNDSLSAYALAAAYKQSGDLVAAGSAIDKAIELDAQKPAGSKDWEKVLNATRPEYQKWLKDARLRAIAPPKQQNK